MNFGIYLIPSIFTIGNLISGLWSIYLSMKEDYSMAAWMILIAIIFDGFDGFIARTLKITSRMGIEMDSFSDFISFIIAPSVLIYSVVLWQYKTPGLMVIVVYIIFGMLRLSRYNVMAHEKENKNIELQLKTSYFEGLPVPAPAGILAGLVLSFELFEEFEQGITRKAIPIIMNKIPFLFHSIPVIMIILSFLMITKIHYTSFSRLQLTKKTTLSSLGTIIIAILLIIVYPENMIFIIFLIYVLSGIVNYLYKISKIKSGLLQEDIGSKESRDQ